MENFTERITVVSSNYAALWCCFCYSCWEYIGSSYNPGHAIQMMEEHEKEFEHQGCVLEGNNTNNRIYDSMRD